jgi:hypothetical protein
MMEEFQMDLILEFVFEVDFDVDHYFVLEFVLFGEIVDFFDFELNFVDVALVFSFQLLRKRRLESKTFKDFQKYKKR